MSEKERKAADIVVTSKGGDAPGPDDEGPKPRPELPLPEVKDDSELSEADLELKTNLELSVERTADKDAGVVKLALELMRKEIREATASMTSVPKPLKFLNPHFDTLVKNYEAMEAGENKLLLADILAVLGMTHEGELLTLKYKLLGNSTELAEWGHEFVRSLAGQIGQEFGDRQLKDPVPSCKDLIDLVHIIVPFHFKHNAEAEAVDLLMETDQLSSLVSSGLVDDHNFRQVCLYMLQCADYMDEKEESVTMIDIVYQLYRGQGRHCDALRVALRLRDDEKAMAVFEGCDDENTKKQMALLLGRHRSRLELDDEDDDDLPELAGNNTITEWFADLARELDVVEPKTPEQIYKSHLSETGTTAKDKGDKQVESAKGNLASTFVNGFVNAGFSNDLLMSPVDSKWAHKNQDHGQISAVASYGMVMLWNVENLTKLDKYITDSNENFQAGGLLAVGVTCASVRNESDPALALLNDYLEDGSTYSNKIKIAAIQGLGIAYAGSAREDVQELLMPYVADTSSDASMEMVAMAALSLGMVYVGTADEDVATVIADRLLEASEAELDQALARHLCLGLGLVYLGQEEDVGGILDAVEAVGHSISAFAAMVLTICAYAGTGNVLQVQKLLHKCAEHPDEDTKEEEKTSLGMVQSAAVLGLALVTMGEPIGVDMAARSSEHLLQYGDAAVRRGVPLGLALHHVSNPDYAVVDKLSKLTHDSDAEVSQNAILALGFVGAGTNNSRIAGMLRMLIAFYQNEPNHIFCVRIAQGMLHMGKGLMTLTPFHSDRLLMSHAVVAGLLPVLFCGLDLKATLHAHHHTLLYTLAVAMSPRMLVVVDEDMNPLQVDVRVGQAVDTVGQAGRPKSITGFQTHTTPVLLAAGERAEFGTEEYIPLTSVLEGVVIVRENPDYDKDADATGAAATRSTRLGGAGATASR